MFKLISLISLLLLISCGDFPKDEQGEGGVIGKELLRDDQRYLSSSQVNILLSVCRNLRTKDNKVSNGSAVFEFTYSGKLCNGDEIVDPNNKAFLKVESNSFVLHSGATTTPTFMTNYESHKSGYIKSFCDKVLNGTTLGIKSQILEGSTLYDFAFYNDSDICKMDKKLNSCFGFLIANYNGQGKYIVSQREVVTVSSDMSDKSKYLGIVKRRERHKNCAFTENVEHLVSNFIQAN